MSWVRHAEKPAHLCALPMWDGYRRRPMGSLGDLWRCGGCGRLWRIGRRCDACHHYRGGRHGGQCAVGLAWRPASLWQQLRNRRTR